MDQTYLSVTRFSLRFIKPYWGRFALSTFLTGSSSAVSLYQAYAFSQVLTYAIAYKPGVSFDPLTRILLLWLCAIIYKNIALFTAKYVGVSSAERAAVDMETEAVRHLALLDISWHEKESTGNKMKRIDRGSRAVVDLTRIWFFGVVDIVVSFVGAIYIIARLDPTLSALIIAYQIIYFFIAHSARKRGVRAMKAANIKDEEVTGLWYEIVSNIRSVKVLGMARKVLEHAGVLTDETLKEVRKRIFWFQGGGTAQSIWEGIASVVLVSFVLSQIFQGAYEVGFLVLFYGYFSTLTVAVARISEMAQDAATDKASLERIMEIFDEKVNIDLDHDKRDFPAEWDTVRIKDLSFSYGDNSVLSNISFDIRKGEKVGIVGLSGAGKSTLFKLLLKEHENYDGEILIGNTPLKQIKKSSYVRHIAAVLQETEVFNMTLRNNIVMSNAAISENEELFDQALSIAHVKDFIPKLNLGVETVIGEKGVKLSGGEKQRLGIARAVFKQPELLFLDEATSHLDVESEQKIQDSLKKFFKDVTAVVIAHRLSTIREMDRIIVIENGKVIETGTFDELHERDGRFREFWDKQKN